MYNDLVALDERTHVETVPMNLVEFSNEETEDGYRLFGRFGYSDIQVKKSPKQFETLCKAFNVPFLFAEELPSELLVDIFSTRGEQFSDKTLNWAIDTEEDELIAFGDAKRPYIPFSSIGGILERVGMVDLEGFLGREGIGQITGTHPSKAVIQPRVGDITQSGIGVHINPLFNKPPQVFPWSKRLVCSNGMTSLREQERINVVGHDVDDVLEQIEYQAQRQFEFAERMNHRFADMAGHEVDPVEAMQNLITSYSIPSRDHEMLLAEASALAEEFHTMYDVMNIFTRYASGQYDPIRRFNLQRIGGDATLSDHLNCSRCGTELQ